VKDVTEADGMRENERRVGEENVEDDCVECAYDLRATVVHKFM
jgi:hypothetical protein